jgi:DNA/RNA endonuclease G (NUC1)
LWSIDLKNAVGEYEFIYRRLGDYEINNVFTSNNPNPVEVWYTPDDPKSSFDNGDKDAIWEGIGNGWFYSVLGGGKDLRPYDVPLLDGTLERKEKSELGDFAKYLEDNRVEVMEDNTRRAESRGDFAVPTLFNGNFDAITKLIPSQDIPGWSFYNGSQNNELSQSILEKGVAGNNTFALKLGGTTNEITHNRFVVPDWGVLRFDVHAPDISDTFDDNSNYLTVWIKDENGIFVELKSKDPNQYYDDYYNRSEQFIINPNFERPAVDLRPFQTETGALAAQSQMNRVGYGKDGFETFFIDIPLELRGQVIEIKFELTGNQTIYLDNIAFASSDLRFGMPKIDGQKSRDEVGTSFDSNYLLEKPQYTISYNKDTQLANWVTWQLNENWINIPNDLSDIKFAEDIYVPFTDSRFTHNDYKIPGANNLPYQRGHMSAEADRTRNDKDHDLTFLMSNVMPQLNKSPAPWTLFEEDIRNELVGGGQDLYITAGGYRDNNPDVIAELSASTQPFYDRISDYIPTHYWKVVLVLDRQGLSLEEINTNPSQHIVDAIAIFTPNFKKKLNQEGIAIYEMPGSNRTLTVKPGNQSSGYTQWQTWTVSLEELETATSLEFFSRFNQTTKEIIRQKTKTHLLSGASLLADPDLQLRSSNIFRSFNNTAVGHSSIPDKGTIHSQISTVIRHTFDFGSFEISPNQNSIFQVDPFNLSTNKTSLIEVSPLEISVSEIGLNQIRSSKIGIPKIGIGQVGTSHINAGYISTSQIGSTKISSFQNRTFKISSDQINSTQISIPQNDWSQIHFSEVSTTEIDSSKISFPSSIPSEQFFPVHNSTSYIINRLNSSITNLWQNLLSQTNLDITYKITDLPAGQLAEAQITSFNEFGLPQTGTILIDYNANGIGWFIDITPFENSEFGLENAEWALQATPESEAYGKYDLLTAILHETAHLYGFIDGYAPFEKHITWNNGTPLFIGDNFTATLTPDLDHLQTAHHPYDLLNTHLAPGIRKLPSELDIQILQAIVSEAGSREKGAGRNILQAPLTSTPLMAILNGDFSIGDSSNPQFGWHTRGNSTIVAEQAILREDSPFLSNFTQTFTIPEGAKILQFTIANTQLGPNSQFIPDAFEAALLDAQTLNPLVAPALSLSDSFLNRQPQLLTYKSENVKVSGKINSPTNAQTVYVDISHLTPGTEAILFFDLLGFGEKDSYVIIDDVLISSEIVNPPVAGNDTLTYSWEFGDRSEAVTSDQSSVTHNYTDDGIYTVTVTVSDENGGFTTVEEAIARKIEESGGLVNKYNKLNGNWEETSLWVS